MIVDRYDPVNLFELVPKLKLEFEPELAHLDELLDDDQLFELLKADLLTLPRSAKLGSSLHSRRGDPEDAGGQETLRMELRANRTFRLRFNHLEAVLPPVSAECSGRHHAHPLGEPDRAETVAALNDRAVELARSLKVTRGRKLRTDGTVVETNIHHPTDDTLLADGVRVVSRLVRRAKDLITREFARSTRASLSGTAP